MTSIISIFKKVLAVLTAAIVINSTVAAANLRPLTIRLEFKLETAKSALSPRFKDGRPEVLKFQPVEEVLKAVLEELPQVVGLTLVVPPEQTEEEKNLQKLAESIAELRKAMNQLAEKIKNLPPPPPPPAPLPPEEPREFYSLKTEYEPGAKTAKLVFECVKLCMLFDRLASNENGIYAQELEGKGSIKIPVDPLKAQRPAIKTKEGNIVLSSNGDIISPTAKTAGTFAAEPLEIITASLADAPIRESYSQTLGASGGGGPPYTWSIVSGSLPAGLTLDDDPSTGIISGTPTTAGLSTFTVRVQAGALLKDKVLSITVTGS